MLICLISYILSKRDIFSPPVVLSGIFIISIAIAILNLDLWNFDMGERTFWAVFLGICFFCIGFFCIYFLKQKMTYNLKETKLILGDIYIKRYKLILFFMVQLLTLWLFYKDFSMIVFNSGGANSLSEAILLFRVNTIINNNEAGTISSLVSNLLTLCKISTYFFSYCFWYEYFIFRKKNFIYLIFFIIPITISLLEGGREGVVVIILTFFIIMYLLWLINNNWKKVVSLKLFLMISSILILFLILFSSVGLYILGRNEQFEKSLNITENIFRQISIYVGAPLKLLDMYMYTDYSMNNLTGGMSTFRNIYIFLGKYFNINEWIVPISFGGEFRIDNGQLLGNVYTMFRPYIQDFGYIGLIILTILMGLIMGYMYFLIRYKQSFNIINFNIVLYSMLFICLIEGFFSDIFYRILFSTFFIKFIIYFKILEHLFLPQNILSKIFNNKRSI